MNEVDVINTILSTSDVADLFDTTNYKKKYVEFLKLIHPDVCKLSTATEACIKLNAFKRELDIPSTFDDDAGKIHMIDDITMIQSGERSLLEKSLREYRRLMSLTDKASQHFKRYLPASMDFSGTELKIQFELPVVPLHKLLLPLEHSIWVTSRMLECAAWFNQSGVVHGGLLPNSVAVVPESHGIVVFSFYHTARLNTSISTVSGSYQHWYPASLFASKKAEAKTDLTLIQQTSLYLLGDRSGCGVKLKKKYPEAYINFLLASHSFPYETYDDFRTLRSELFGKPTYFHLNI